MNTIQTFEDIQIWKQARELTQIIYQISSKEQFSKDYGLKDQIRRSSVSIMSNIAEGFERCSNKEFILFLSYSKGSCGELRSQLYVAYDQHYIDEDNFMVLSGKAIELSKMISGFMKYLRNSGKQRSKI